MRSVVLSNRGIGDVIMSLPLLKAMVQEEGDHLLVVSKSKTEAEILALAALGPGRWESVGLRELGSNSLRRFLRLMWRIRTFEPDTLIFSHGVDQRRGAVLSALSGAKRRIGTSVGALSNVWFTHKVPGQTGARRSYHKVAFNRELAALAGRRAPERPEIVLAPESPTPSLEVLEKGRWLALAFGSGAVETHKRYPLARILSFVDKIRSWDPEMLFVLLGSSAEMERNRRIAETPTFAGLDLTGRTSLSEAFWVLSRCAMAITSCNGISHMAGAVGCPVIGLYGPTQASHTGPNCKSFVPISLNMSCSPCYRRGFIEGCGNPTCMEIPAEIIVGALKRASGNIVSAPDLGHSGCESQFGDHDH